MPEVKEGYSLSHAFRYFRKKYKSKGDNFMAIDKRTYRNVCKDFNKMLTEDVLAGGAGVRLPFSLGCIWIKKFKINWNKPPIDIYETVKTGEIVYHLNAHSDGWMCAWKWSKRNTAMKNLIYYSFKQVRTSTRASAAVMKEPGGHNKYFTNQI